ncbi:trehalase family glycosidase [Amorphus sp. 3PC139-8]|uniref:MGH1-like glycoside hydrolase domain-containing protein n=1 Tax=Amorphus sp. 3PC139-8 TaxID=2735676 RepID=UPI00345D7FFD
MAVRRGVAALAAAVARGWRLLVFATYLLLWSKVFKGHHFLEPVEAALLHAKGVRHLPPELDVDGPDGPDPAWTQGFAAIHAALFLNLRNPDTLSSVRYARPAPSFRAVYLWDSAFIAQIWKGWDPEVAFDVLRSVVMLREGDRLQHFVSDLSGSPFTQPPLIAWSLAELLRTVPPEQSRAWARVLYPPLKAYHDWLMANRRLDNGLFAWAHPYESGVENAPRFSSRDESRLADTCRLAAPDFSAYMVLKSEALAHLARLIGDDAAAETFEAEACALAERMNALLWDEAEGLYFDRDTDTGAFVKSRTIASLLPLWAGIPDRPRAERLVAHIVDPNAFNTVIPLPSVALNDRDFEKDMWRGPVWLNTAYAVLAGLTRYGFHAEAADLAFRLCNGVYQTFARTGRFHEFYDPEQHGVDALARKRGNLWKRLTLGGLPVTEFVGWSGLVNTLVLDTLIGLERTERELAITPRFPPHAEGRRFSLRLPAPDLRLTLRIGPEGAVRGTLVDGETETTFAAAFGERVAIVTTSPDQRRSA